MRKITTPPWQPTKGDRVRLTPWATLVDMYGTDPFGGINTRPPISREAYKIVEGRTGKLKEIYHDGYVDITWDNPVGIPDYLDVHILRLDVEKKSLIRRDLVVMYAIGILIFLAMTFLYDHISK